MALNYPCFSKSNDSAKRLDNYEQFMWLDLEMKIGPLVIRLGGICMNKHWISLYQNCWSVLEILEKEKLVFFLPTSSLPLLKHFLVMNEPLKALGNTV